MDVKAFFPCRAVGHRVIHSVIHAFDHRGQTLLRAGGFLVAVPPKIDRMSFVSGEFLAERRRLCRQRRNTQRQHPWLICAFSQFDPFTGSFHAAESNGPMFEINGRVGFHGQETPWAKRTGEIADQGDIIAANKADRVLDSAPSPPSSNQIGPFRAR